MDQTDSRSARWNRLSILTMGVGVSAFIAAGVIAILLLTGFIDNGSGYSGPGTVTAFGNLDPSMFFTPEPTPTAEPTPPSDAPLERFLIPKFEIDAPVTVKGIDENNKMEDPDGAWDVVWYDFTGRPGFGGNAVFSGHVDYIDVGPAVFWDVKGLEEGDLVEVRLTDGTLYQYRVYARQQVEAEADVSGIVGPTEEEIVTLITCIGTFDEATGQYDQRLIVRARRVASPEAAQAPPLR